MTKRGVGLSARSTLREVVQHVGGALQEEGIQAVLTGGACAHLYTRGRFASADVDLVLLTSVTTSGLDEAMAAAGFLRKGHHYVHARTPFVVEFPPGPLGIGRDLNLKPVRLRLGRTTVLALSPTDSCRDRLAAFYHWNDRQSLRTAAAIARRHRLNLGTIRRWSEREGFQEKFDEFLTELG